MHRAVLVPPLDVAVLMTSTQVERWPLQAGRCYELRCTAPVVVAFGSGAPRADVDVVVVPEAPLRFIASTQQAQVQAWTSATPTTAHLLLVEVR